MWYVYVVLTVVSPVYIIVSTQFVSTERRSYSPLTP